MLGLSFVLVTTQGISNNYSKYSGEGSNSGNGIGISPPDIDGASNAEDLRVLAECQDATGTVIHTKKMDDGDYKFFSKVDEQFKFLVNEKNDEKTDGFLVVEIVPPHQDGMYLP